MRWTATEASSTWAGTSLYACEVGGELEALLAGGAAEGGAGGAVDGAHGAAGSGVDVETRETVEAQCEVAVAAHVAPRLTRHAAPRVQHPPRQTQGTHCTTADRAGRASRAT